MSYLNQLQEQKKLMYGGNPILSEEINTLNTYFIPFVFDMIYDSGSCMSDKENKFIAAYKGNYDKFIEEYPQVLENTQFKNLIDSELNKSYFVLTNNFFHIINKIQPIGISIDLSTIKINIKKPNILFTKLQKLEISGEVVQSNIPEINLGHIEFELEMGKKTSGSVIQTIKYFQLILKATKSGEIQQQSFHIKDESMFHHSIMLNYSAKDSETFLFTQSRLFLEASKRDESISMIMQYIVNTFMELEQNKKLNLDNILKDSFLTEKFNIYNHNLSSESNLLSLNLEPIFTEQTVNYSDSAHFDSIENLYNLKFKND